MTPLAVLATLTRWVLLAAVLMQAGAAAFRFIVLPRLRGEGATGIARSAATRAARLGLTGACLLLVAALARLPLQLLDVSDPASPLLPQMHALMVHTMWGKTWHAQLALALVSAILFAVARGGRLVPWVLAALASIAVAFTPALSGHAIGSERLTDLAIVADGVHVLAASAWLGAMLMLFSTVTLPRDAGHEALAGALVASFSTMALIAVATAIVSGTFSAWLHISPLSALWQSRYGRRLLLKLGAVAIMAGLGAFNWRRAGPKLLRDNDVAPMRRSIRAELVTGALVLLATAVLIATPPPGEE